MNAAKIQILPLRRVPIPTKPAVSRSDTSASSASDDQSPASKRARASKPKVRTGCQTCKIRRIKCDEIKPACLKCTSTGRTCDGYVAPPPRKGKNSDAPFTMVSRTPEPTRGLALSPMKISSSEVRALEYFCLQTAADMGMYFDADFWSRFVVQASVAESALRHAMVAVGIFDQLRETRDTNRIAVPQTGLVAAEGQMAMSVPAREPNTDKNEHIALVNYNQAIGLLTKRMGPAPGTTDMVLLACILFVCVEFLRGDDRAALRHFTGGMAIANNTIAKDSPGSLTMIDRIKSSILPFFNRLEMLYTLFGHDTDWAYPVTLTASIPDAFYSVSQARDSIVHLMNLSLRFIRPLQPLRYDPSPMPSSAYDEQAALLRQLRLWHSRFSTYQSKHATNLTPNDLYASNVIHIQRLVTQIWLSVAMTPLECAHDPHIAAYTEIVTLAEQLRAIASTQNQHARYSNTFVLDVELVGPLHWASIKCRDPVVRRRAIAVMRGTHRREGLWDSKIAIAVADRVVAVEEAGLQDGELPSEVARVHGAFVPTWMDTGARGWKHVLGFSMKPYGVYDDWLEWQEEVVLEE